MKTVILGATGYTGLLLIRLLGGHPEVERILAVSSTRPGDRLADVDPGLGALDSDERINPQLQSLAEAVREKPDVVFAALPHLKSADICKPFFGSSVVIDLSADFRLKDPQIFQTAYGAPLPRADLMKQAVYGLPEWYSEQIRQCDIIANPGCYPTAALLPTLPLAERGLISGSVLVNAISGISGAGRKAKVEYLFCELSENVTAYAPGKRHRHSWEMEAELQNRNSGASVLFVPHLAPFRRGIAATISTKLTGSGAAVEQALNDCYGQTPFVRLRRAGIPQTREVRGTNRCDIGWHIEGENLLLFSVIDNLMKGASGQAVQNMNVRFGFEETAGLPVDSAL